MNAERHDESAREMVIRRMVNAPAELVWQAWTTPGHLAHWWGPDGFTITTQSHEFKVGGVWKFTMHGPDGKDYPNHTVFQEIDPPRKLVYAHGGESPARPAAATKKLDRRKQRQRRNRFVRRATSGRKENRGFRG